MAPAACSAAASYCSAATSIARAIGQPSSRARRSTVQWSTTRPSRAAGMPKRLPGRRHAQVAGDGELRAGSERRAVDGGDRRDRQLAEPAQHAAQRGGELALLDAGEVGTGAERRRRAGEHEHPRVGRLALGVEQAEQRGVVDGVAPLRPVERDDEDARATVDAAVVAVPRHPYHAADSMSDVPDDPDPPAPGAGRPLDLDRQPHRLRAAAASPSCCSSSPSSSASPAPWRRSS